MKIEEIFVAGFRHDIQFTRTCVASIRRWYPDIPITLIKDRFYGDYSTADIERAFSCDVLQSAVTRFGWGFGKLEPLFLETPRRFLVLDSDIVFTGPVLDRLESHAEDFVVQWEEPSPGFVRSHYFDLEKLIELDPSFSFPGYTFNTGQWVGTSGRLRREDFAPFITGSPPKLLHPAIFKLGEQGLLNYILIKQASAGRLTLARNRFMEVASDPDAITLDLSRLRPDAGYPFLIHWCGLRQSDFSEMIRGDILDHFEEAFYARLPAGPLRRRWFYFQRNVSVRLKKMLRRKPGRSNV